MGLRDKMKVLDFGIASSSVILETQYHLQKEGWKILAVGRLWLFLEDVDIDQKESKKECK